jgi:hypothetical protein
MTVQFLATAALLALGLAPVGSAAGAPGRIRETLRSDLLSKADYERMERGYYERILDAGRKLGSTPALATRRADWKGWTHLDVAPFDAGPLAQVVDDLREFVLKPNLSIVHDGASWSTNALGMRDQPYETAKPPHTLRIALVGDSIGAGWGVNDGQGFEPTLERWLDERSRAAGGPAVEFLNFAVPGHGPGQRWDHFGRVGWATEPDLIVYESTQADASWDERRLRGLLPRGIGWDSPLYRDTLARTGARPGGTMEEYKRVLRPHRWEFVAGVYRTIAADCRRRDVPIVWVLVPRVGKAADRDDLQRLTTLARSAGFSAVIDLSDAYDGLDPTSLAIGPNDYHPNAKGHALLARRLDAALGRHPELRRLWPPSPGAAAGGARP